MSCLKSASPAAFSKADQYIVHLHLHRNYNTPLVNDYLMILYSFILTLHKGE